VKKGDVLFEHDAKAAQIALEKAKAELAAAEAKLAGVRTAQLDVARAQLELEATKVTAPISGKVGLPQVAAGTLVFRGQDRATVLTRVSSVDPIGLEFGLDQRSFLRYQQLIREKKVKGAGSSLRVRLPDEDWYPHDGTLDSFGDQVEPRNRVAVRGHLPNPDNSLLPGMVVSIRMSFGPPRPAVKIPERAIYIERDKAYVFVVNEHDVLEFRAVTLGSELVRDETRIVEKRLTEQEEMRIVEKGLTEQDRVARDVHFAGIRPGVHVEPREEKAPAK
jgi:RND family efflux transporter MFP subunit